MSHEPADPSFGWSAVTDEFVALRSESGADVIRRWAATLKPKSAILDVGAGTGEPVTRTLVEAGHRVFAIDAAPAMVDRFRTRLPEVPVRCETVEKSSFFERRFDAVVAVGLIFLLPEDNQSRVIARLADILLPRGHFLISAPREEGSWTDTLTQRPSHSLGYKRYIQIMSDAGIVAIESLYDEAGSHYFAGVRECTYRGAAS